MSKVKNPELDISVEIAVEKFFLREMLFFFKEMRNKTMLDKPFTFTAKDFSSYVEKMHFSKIMSIYINDQHIKTSLKIMSDSFKRRDDKLHIISNNRGPIKLLDYTVENNNGGVKFHIKNCETDFINNAIRYLDISLSLRNKDDLDDDELERKIESLNNESFFGQTANHCLTFCNTEKDIVLGAKERAIFNILKTHFKKDISYNDIFEEYLQERGNQGTNIIDRKGYVNDGITELRKKLFKISGNPETIITKGGRESMYKLVY